MSKQARDYLAALFATTPRFGMVAWNNSPDNVEFTDTPHGDWVQVSDIETLIDHLEDVEADEVPEPEQGTLGLYGAIAITEFERAVNTTPERRRALLDAKLANLRDSILDAWEMP